MRAVVEGCARAGVEYLTLFAFSSENWRRPNDEVSFLMRLFITALEREVGKLHANGIRLRVVGDLDRFEPRIRELIRRAETKTARNTRLTLTIAANYGGRWDILQATKKLVEQAVREGREVEVTEDAFAPHLAMAYAPAISSSAPVASSASATSCCGSSRTPNSISPTNTGRISTARRWPTPSRRTERERRFGRTSAQLEPQSQNADSLSC